MLIPATAWEGKDYGHLKELYGRLIGQRDRELMHVANVIGGVEQVTKHVGQSGPVYQPLPRARGVEAMSFLLKHAFQTPTQLFKPEILTKIQASGNVSLVMRGQSRILRNLLSDERANRMIDLETMDSSAYTLHQMASDLRAGLFGELESETVAIDAHRRALQRDYVEVLGHKLQGDKPSRGVMRALARGELNALKASLEQAQAKDLETAERYHIEARVAEINRAFEP